MRNFTDKQIRQAKDKATSYLEFREDLKLRDAKMPSAVSKFPHGMKGWIRKLRYEISQDPSFGKPTTEHDIRQARYYKRLKEMGCPEPLIHME